MLVDLIIFKIRIILLSTLLFIWTMRCSGHPEHLSAFINVFERHVKLLFTVKHCPSLKKNSYRPVNVAQFIHMRFQHFFIDANSVVVERVRDPAGRIFIDSLPLAFSDRL